MGVESRLITFALGLSLQSVVLVDERQSQSVNEDFIRRRGTVVQYRVQRRCATLAFGQTIGIIVRVPLGAQKA